MAAKMLVKPEITIGDYRIRWVDSTEGIPEEDVTAFRTFIRDCTPYLNSVRKAADNLHKEIEQSKMLDRYQVDTNVMNIVITMQSQSTKSDADYVISITWDGVAFVDRRTENRENSMEHLVEYIAELASVG